MIVIVIVMMGISHYVAVGVTIMRMVLRNTNEIIDKLSRQHWETVGDREYMLAWDKVLLPIARQWQPDIIIVSAGFDAVRVVCVCERERERERASEREREREKESVRQSYH